jgi:hypothetical protein
LLRTRLGKIRRHLPPEIFKQAKEQKSAPEKAGTSPIALEQMA